MGPAMCCGLRRVAVEGVLRRRGRGVLRGHAGAGQSACHSFAPVVRCVLEAVVPPAAWAGWETHARGRGRRDGLMACTARGNAPMAFGDVFPVSARLMRACGAMQRRPHDVHGSFERARGSGVLAVGSKGRADAHAWPGRGAGAGTEACDVVAPGARRSLRRPAAGSARRADSPGARTRESGAACAGSPRAARRFADARARRASLPRGCRRPACRR